MQLTLRELETSEIVFNQVLAPGVIDLAGTNFRQSNNLQVSGVATLLTGTEQIGIRGRLVTKLEGECDRCLESAELEVNREFTLQYRRSTGKEEEDESEIGLDDAETEIGYYEGVGVELTTVLREQLLLWIPMHWVCSESCKGICPECGENLNRQTCGCSKQRDDARWAALRNFKPSK
jgi:DUF177 domain-containing protein